MVNAFGYQTLVPKFAKPDLNYMWWALNPYRVIRYYWMAYQLPYSPTNFPRLPPNTNECRTWLHSHWARLNWNRSQYKKPLSFDRNHNYFNGVSHSNAIYFGN